MTDTAVPEAMHLLAQTLEQDLFSKYGPMIGHNDLRAVLAYPSMEAFRQAMSRGQLPVPVFAIANRRGKFALTKDIALWLATARSGASKSNT